MCKWMKGKKRRRRKQSNWTKQSRRRRKISKGYWHGQSPCASAHGHFHQLSSLIFSPKFFPDFGEKTFCGAPFIFLPPRPTKHTLKKFYFPFPLQSYPSTLFHLQTNTPLSLDPNEGRQRVWNMYYEGLK